MLAEISQELAGVIPVLDLDYEQESQSFLHPAYQALADRVLAYARRKRWNFKTISEIERNLERGKLGCDWWTSEKDLRFAYPVGTFPLGAQLLDNHATTGTSQP